MKTRLILFGAGKIGDAIAHLLAATGDYALTVADCDDGRLAAIAARGHEGLRVVRADLGDSAALGAVTAGHDVALSACPFFLTPAIAAAARNAGAHYFDLTEDVESTRIVRQLAEGADTAFVPQCGLAPGYVSIAAHALADRFDRLRMLRLRVGALPRYPSNALKYNLSWSTEGLINEYCNPCEAVVDGRPALLQPMEGLERFALDGVEYEAFNTSGGLGSLAASLAGKVPDLSYKTIRYPGHCELMRVLLHDLRLGQPERRRLLRELLESALPATPQDTVLVFITACGERDGRLEQESHVQKIHARSVHGRHLSAIQLATAAGACAMVDLLREGRLPRRGLVRQEQARLQDFLANRFGSYYAEQEHAQEAACTSPNR
ncbi:saccharopine dehydrogenase family protein [Noviherbaspirillum aridicola]|uniref:Saccharopine dehydrogenase n=1 Tax=Noviherbaspirillum aridicola TaxID=2849687 RepID=A0ABQ4Q9G5_9BURK|nr:saccharopine dehydrogenase C-terminal domain-containing protein [Noviherbaspirillum aridicola]GIZ53864.1 saccharopine dehydrogenase [Noviherbaspirillum aridicola]